MRKVQTLGTRPIIDGLDVETAKTFQAVSPSTGLPIAEVHRAGKGEIDAAVAAAKKAFLHWGSLPVRERQRFLQKVMAEVVRLHEPLARLIAAEQGKPVAEARAV
ncbi:MAG TPA: aldehyde dehydrogenase family protein, partial [Thermoanaerobaculia bacterium]